VQVMQTIRETGLNLPEATYHTPKYKEAGMRNFMNLVRTMLNDYGVYHVQFNTINKETLKDAKAHPENYPTLMVRVAGYSVYWTDIAERVQDDIIHRTEHQF
jgi:pyruvate-formate lyase